MRRLRSLCGPSLACLVVAASTALSPAAANSVSYEAHTPQLMKIQALTDRAMRHYRGGDIKAAVDAFEAVVATARQHFGTKHLKFTQALNNLALIYDAAGEPERSEHLYRQAIAIVQPQAQTDAQSIHLADLQNNLAAVVLQQCRFADARTLYKRALVLSEETRGPSHNDTAMVRRNVARLDRYLGAPSLTMADGTGDEAAAIGQILQRCVS